MPDIRSDQDEYAEEKLQNINLIEEELHSKKFYDCVFEKCNFSESSLAQCRFHDCEFINCNLSAIKISGTAFNNVAFKECKVVGVNWTSAAWPRVQLNSGLKFDKCILNGSSFFGLNLREVEMIECKVQDTDFTEADCEDGDFSYSDLENSTFRNTNLTRANFTESSHYNIDIFSNTISRAKFNMPEAVILLYSLDIELSE